MCVCGGWERGGARLCLLQAWVHKWLLAVRVKLRQVLLLGREGGEEHQVRRVCYKRGWSSSHSQTLCLPASCRLLLAAAPHMCPILADALNPIADALNPKLLNKKPTSCNLALTCASSLMVRPLMVSTRPSATYTASTAALLPPVPPYSADSVASVSVPAVTRKRSAARFMRK